MATGQVVTIDRWTGRHFETLGTLTGGEDVIEVGPGDTEALLSLSTRDPQFPTAEAGWFRLNAILTSAPGPSAASTPAATSASSPPRPLTRRALVRSPADHPATRIPPVRRSC